jgi:hypothetical protein
MKSVSRRVAKYVGAFVIISLLVQPVMAATSSRKDEGSFGTILKKLVARIFDTTQISFPPG